MIPITVEDLPIKDVESGTWYKYSFDTSEMFLHERLGLEVAAALAIWDDLKELKVTRNEHDKIIGIVKELP